MRARSLVVSATALLPAFLGLTAADVAVAVQERQLGSVPEPWVTVDGSGNAATVTPAVSRVKDGGTATVSAPPAYLTQTSVFTLADGGHTTTATGLAPFATASGPGPAGAFFACDNYQGVDSPFCLPRRGSQLSPGRTYYGESSW